MGVSAHGRVATPEEFSGILLGTGVVCYGDVSIGVGTYVGDGVVIGAPAIDEINSELDDTVVGERGRIGAYTIIHNGARVGAGVIIDDRCIVGTETVIEDRAQLRYAARLFWKVHV